MGTVETSCTEVGTGTGRSTGGADGVNMVFWWGEIRVHDRAGIFIFFMGDKIESKHQIWEGQIWSEPILAQIRSDHSDLMFGR